MIDVVHEPVDDEQAEMHICPPDDFCGFGLEHGVSIHPIFKPCTLNANIARLWNGSSSSSSCSSSSSSNSSIFGFYDALNISGH